MRHSASGATLMVVMGVLGPSFWLGLSARIATAPARDFFEMLDARPSQPPVSAAEPVADDMQDVMNIPAGKKAA